MRRRKRKFRNHLYALRRNRRYAQKHVAHMLGHKGTQMISRYETGGALPPLKTALLLQVILGAQVSDIYPDLFREMQELAVVRESQLSPALGRQVRGRAQGRD